MEDLNVAGMIKNHKLAKSIADVSWSEFERQLKYKADWYGRKIIQIGRFEPSSKKCNCCEYINQELTLADREWLCPNCGVKHDRDINGAINILETGKIIKSGSGRSKEDAELLPLGRTKKRQLIALTSN